MDKRNKLIMGCTWFSGLCAGAIYGSLVNEKINQKYVVPSIKIYRELAETLRDQLYKEIDKNDRLEKEILNK